jgi:hypothetical protein
MCLLLIGENLCGVFGWFPVAVGSTDSKSETAENTDGHSHRHHGYGTSLLYFRSVSNVFPMLIKVSVVYNDVLVHL